MFGTSSPFPLSDRILRKFTGKGPRFDYLAPFAVNSRQFTVHDFTRSITADVTNTWSVSATSTATTWAALAEPGGWIRGATGTSVATAGLQIYAPTAFWNGTSGAGFASRIRLSAITEIRVEIGFADVIPANSVTAVNLASNAFQSVTAGAVYLYNHTGSTTTTGLYTVGTSIAFSSVATTTNRFVAATTLFVAMEVNGTNVQVWVGNGDSPLVRKAGALEAATALIPFINIKGSGGAHNVDLDMLATWTLART